MSDNEFGNEKKIQITIDEKVKTKYRELLPFHKSLDILSSDVIATQYAVQCFPDNINVVNKPRYKLGKNAKMGNRKNVLGRHLFLRGRA